MGAIGSKPPEFNQNVLKTWTLNMHVKSLYQRYCEDNYDFGVDKTSFKALMTDSIPGTTTLIDEIWDVFDPNRAGLVHMLEVMAAICAMSWGSVVEKLDFIFNLFDFSAGGDISYDETVILMCSALAGIVKLGKVGRLPEDPEMEQLADEAFLESDKDANMTLTKKEFVDWVMKTILTDGEKTTLESVLMSFGLKPKEVAAPIAAPEGGEDAEEEEEEEEEYQSGQEMDEDLALDLAAPQEPPAHAVMHLEDGEPEDSNMFLFESNSTDHEFVPVLPWRSDDTNTIDASLNYLDGPPAHMEMSLRLDHIHGFKCDDCRNNVLMLDSDEIVYHTATLGVVLNTSGSSPEQRFYLGHTDEILSIAMHPDGRTVATGQKGAVPSIHIWDSETLETLVILRGFHKRAVLHLAFSNSGDYLASIGQDEDHSLAVYHWENGRGSPWKSSKVDTNKILHLAFTEDDASIITVGLNHAAWWSLTEGRQFKMQPGTFGKKGSKQPLMAVACFGDKVVTATVSGRLYEWEGRNCVGGGKKHESTVTALWTNGEVLISGGKDGKIKLYDKKLEKIAQYDLHDTDSFQPRVRSVSMSKGGVIVVGSRGGEIYTFPGGKKVHEGHFEGELWALATHPTRAIYATAGDDMTMRIWDCDLKQCIGAANLDSFARAAAFSPDGQSLAVGTGGRDGCRQPEVSGGFRVLDADTLEVKFSGQDTEAWIGEVKYSPDGSTLAVGSCDSRIYLYSVHAGYQLKAACDSHRGRVMHIDFTADSAFLQADCDTMELVFFDAATGALQRRGDLDLRDASWATWTCPLGWPVQGAWPARPDGTVLHAVDRCNSEEVMAVGDSFGRLQLLQFPLPGPDALATARYIGHAPDPVSRVRFTCDDSFLISTGRKDKTVFQWKFDKARAAEAKADVSSTAPGSAEEAGAEGAIDVDAETGMRVARSQAQAQADSGFGDVLAADADADADGGGELAKPWRGIIEEPSEHMTAAKDTAPIMELELAWVYGYQAQTTRQSLHYTGSGDIVYSVGRIGVCYNPEEHQQRYYMEQHTDDIASLALSADGMTIATGQLGARACVHVWDAQSMEQLAVLKGHRGGVAQILFSDDGQLLATLGLDKYHTLMLHDWKSGNRVAKGRTSKRQIMGIAMNRDNTQLCVVGDRFLSFCDVNGRAFKGSRGVFGERGRLQAVHSTAYAAVVGASDEQLCYTGQQDGSIYQWRGGQLTAAFQAHSAAVSVLFALPAGAAADAVLLSGAKDGRVLRWSGKGGEVGDKPAEVADFGGVAVRSVCQERGGQRVLVGTAESEIYEVVGDVKELLHQSHCSAELWGLATAPKGDCFVTAGDDATLRVWDTSDRRLVTKKQMKDIMRAAAYSPDGGMIAVGFGGERSDGEDEGAGGGFCVVDAVTLDIIFEGKDSKEWIQDVKFSPDGVTLAVCSHDCKIYLYDVQADFAKKAVCKGHSRFITHMDFTADSRNLQSTCGAYELLFWDCASGSQKPSGAIDLKDAAWASWTCPLGWPVQGIWPAIADGTEYNAVDRSHKGDLVVAADDFGRLKLFNYPCVTSGCGSDTYFGHSSHVTNCRWTSDDNYVISIGGRDRAVFQWVSCIAPDVEEVADDDLVREGEHRALPAVVEAALAGLHFEMDFEDAGEDFMGVKPWRAVIQAPSPMPAIDPAGPEFDELELEWVHGYRSSDVRNNLFYLASSEIVYHTATIGIVYNSSKHEQRVYVGHSNDIISLTVHPDGNLVATGQLGARPEIHIWDSSTMETVAVLRGHIAGVSKLAFSADGSQLLSSGLDAEHSLIVHDWNAAKGSAVRVSKQARGMRVGKEGGIVSKCKGHRDKILDLAMSGAGEICAVGVMLVKFWKHGLGRKGRKGVFGGKGKLQPILSCAYVGECCVTGTASGDLYIWEGGRCTKAMEAHSLSVNSLFPTVSGGFLSGGKDGLLKLWDSFFNCLLTIDVSDDDIAGARCCEGMSPDPQSEDYYASNTNPNAICAVSEDDETKSIVIGTRSAEIFEIQAGEAKLLQQGHSFGETWGCAVSPKGSEFATAGDDQTLRIWDTDAKTLVRKKRMECFVRALAYSTDGMMIAVGYGGRLDDADCGYEEGAFRVLDAATLEFVHKAQDTKEYIHDIKFSPEGGKLAVCSHDTKVYIYDIKDSFSLKTIISGHNSHITHMDFTADGTRCQTTCGAYELLFWNAWTGAQDPDGGTNFKGAEWASWTCPLGWPVQGIWPAIADGTEYNAVDRSHKGDLVVAADDFGRLKLFNYPCVTSGCGSDTYFGHSSHVTNCRWTSDDNYVISTGGRDRAVFQWKHTHDSAGVSETKDSLVDDGLSDESESSVLDAYSWQRSAAQEAANQGMRFEDAAATEEEAERPWRKALREPSDNTILSPAPPAQQLALDWVHGYQAQRFCNNLRYSAAGDIVYPVACVGVVYDKASHRQRFARHNSDDIVSFALSPNGKYAATGELGTAPKVCVWDTATMREVATLVGVLRCGVSQVAFSKDSSKLACCSLDEDQTVAVYDFANEKLIGKEKGGRTKILGMAFSSDHSVFYAAGGPSVARYKFTGRTLKKQRCRFGTETSAPSIISVVCLEEDIAWTGARDGSLAMFQGLQCIKVVRNAHEGPIYALSEMALEAGMFLSGGEDGQVCKWSIDGDREDTLVTFEVPVRSCCSSAEGICLVGTSESEIYEIQEGNLELIVEAHHKGEVWGLTTAPKGDCFVTAGDDATLRVWDIRAHKQIVSSKMKDIMRAAAYSPDGGMIAVGFGGERSDGEDEGAGGGFCVVDAVTLDIIFEGKDSKEWIQDVKFSPDGVTLAVCSHDCKIYLYDVQADFAKKAVCKGHSRFITHMDFTADGKKLQSTCGAYELLFWDSVNGAQMPSGAIDLKDAAWASWTCPLGWPVQGIWPAIADGTEYNAVDRSHKGDLVVAADDFGRLKLFNYPCVTSGCGSDTYFGHSSHVTNCRWTSDDKFVISTGGRDRAVFQWVLYSGD